MSDTYVECLVNVPVSTGAKFAKILLTMLTIAFAFLMFIGFWPAFFLGLATGFGAYFVGLRTDIEYEASWLHTAFLHLS